jgi:hypothetical protein
MNEKEIREIRRRFRPEKCMIGSIYGCYVNENKKIISLFEEPLCTMPAEEAARYLGLMKKALSGTLGKNLVNLEFSTQQVMEGEEHKLLSLLRETGLKDQGVLETFLNRVIDSVDVKGNYLILIARDVYSVPYHAKDGTFDKDAQGQEEYAYLLCSICPVKLTDPALSYYSVENRFHAGTQGWIVSAPEVGFLFPAFDSRSTNLYGALYYTKNTGEPHQGFIDALFHVEPPIPADLQKETFQALLESSLEKECRLEVVQAVHEQLCELMEQHKESKETEPLLISAGEIGCILEDSGVSKESAQAFCTSFEGQFGEGATLPPENVINKKRFEIRTPDVLIRVNPDRSDLIETRVIDGSKYILVSAEGGMEVNGVNVHIRGES